MRRWCIIGRIVVNLSIAGVHLLLVLLRLGGLTLIVVASDKLLLRVLVTVGSPFKVLPTCWASYMVPVDRGLICTCLLNLLRLNKACNVSMRELLSNHTHVSIAMSALGFFEAGNLADGFYLHECVCRLLLLLHLIVVIVGGRQVGYGALVVGRCHSNVTWLRDVGFCSLDKVHCLLLLRGLLVEQILLLHSFVCDVVS